MKFDRIIISLLQDTVKREGWLDLPAEGNSMFPLIKAGDICRFITWKETECKKGEILLFWAESGQLIAHRFHYRQTFNGNEYFVCKGDTNLGFDTPITKDRILGKLEYIQKSSRKVKPQNIVPEIWKNLLIHIPIISCYLRGYLNRRSVSI